MFQEQKIISEDMKGMEERKEGQNKSKARKVSQHYAWIIPNYFLMWL